jgi:hypothetical protein
MPRHSHELCIGRPSVDLSSADRRLYPEISSVRRSERDFWEDQP